MKKGLSVLLIAAALFGFYGGAVNLNDVLACKDYWEKAGEESTANMNKLEDGLNQLNDNEQAYLDGKDQVADGEKALAEAETQLADGEAQLEAGRAELAKGEADYAAAPQKLADGKAQLDANKDSYTAGKSFKAIVDKASNGLSNKGAYNIIKGLLASSGTKGVPASYKEMASTRSSLNDLKDGTDNITDMGSEKAFKVAVSTQSSATQKQLKNAGVTSYKALKNAISTANGGVDSMEELKDKVDQFTGKTEKELREILVKSSSDLKKNGIKNYKTLKNNEAKLRAGKNLIDKLAAMDEDQLKNALVAQNEDLQNADITTYDKLAETSEALTAGKKQIDDLAADRDALKNYIVKGNDDLKNAGITTYDALEKQEAALSAGRKLVDDLVADSDALRDYIVSNSEELKNAGISTYKGLEDKIASLEEGKATVDGLVADRDVLKNYIVSNNEDLQKAGVSTYKGIEEKIGKLEGAQAQVNSIGDNNDSKAVKSYLVGIMVEGMSSYNDLVQKIQSLEVAKSDKESTLDTLENKEDKEKAEAEIAAITENINALKAAQKTVDDLEGNRNALKDLLVSKAAEKNEELSNASITSYAALTGAIQNLKDGKQEIEQVAGMEEGALRDFLVSQAAEKDPDMKKAGITTYAVLTGTIQKLKGGKQEIDQIAGMEDGALRDFLVSQAAEKDPAMKKAGITTYDVLSKNSQKLTAGKKQIDGIASMSDADLKDFLVSQSSALKEAGIEKYADLEEKEKALKEGKKTIDTIASLDEAARKDAFVGQNEDLQKAGIKNYKALASSSSALTAGKKTVDTVAKNLNKASSDKALAFVWTQLTKQQKKALKSQGVDGTSYKALTKAISSLKGTISSLKQLKKGTDNVTGMTRSEALKTAIGTQDKATQTKLKNSGITSYKSLNSAIGKLDQLAGFTKALTSQKGNSRETTYKNIINTLDNAGYGSMISALPASYRGLASKLAQYEEGVRTYRKGLADYAAAPGKLAEGRRQLAEGEAKLSDGYKQYEEGKQALADGKAQLAQYEDGEQQVRDGLATLVGTKPDLDLQSIFDRLNGDGDFDNGDDHLDIDEGLNAVEVGRGYQADDGQLITNEITARAVGTAGLLGAGVLAVLAALLSFLKKNKGAGVFAILAAAAGAFGAFYGTNAGTYFSDVAGSTVGNTGWVAAGILGVIALAHAIVHFSAKKDA